MHENSLYADKAVTGSSIVPVFKRMHENVIVITEICEYSLAITSASVVPEYHRFIYNSYPRAGGLGFSFNTFAG